jgi:hypothetical protein
MAKVKGFQCLRTGLFFPEDYVENWGKKYGLGLGPVPISEALINDYTRDPVKKADGSQIYPVANCRAQIVPVEVEEAAFEAKKAIIHEDDKGYALRMPIMEARQKKNNYLALSERKAAK